MSIRERAVGRMEAPDMPVCDTAGQRTRHHVLITSSNIMDQRSVGERKHMEVYPSL